MIQRIQSVYLLLMLGLSALLFYEPFYHFGKELGQAATLNMYLYPIAGIICVATIAAIFTYKKRKLQKQICYGLIVLQLLYVLVGGAVTYHIATNFDFHSHGPAFVLPFISIILIVLAIRGINKDEELIRSMDRLR